MCLEHSASVYWVIFGFCFLGHLFSEALEIVSLLFPLSYFPALMVCIPLLVTGLAFVLHCVLKDSIIKTFLLFLEFLWQNWTCSYNNNHPFGCFPVNTCSVSDLFFHPQTWSLFFVCHSPPAPSYPQWVSCLVNHLTLSRCMFLILSSSHTFSLQAPYYLFVNTFFFTIVFQPLVPSSKVICSARSPGFGSSFLLLGACDCRFLS